ncbi:TetR/AcrR family transcriptional regulator [Paenibacillus zeisoli]|uniref:TetR/AcrR family transcriptional regulator n=1 Tax=Paenibacillus zeisoli TaxID=2496267 RepID=A0A3S1CZC4_9BACL|nr:TetR/AcrR family transcriptional regulator [Paenibacillus zeisoli]RUT31689.1 TetR/AcrR family transcriptional regulator [Paenibacillus zeisoli]
MNETAAHNASFQLILNSSEELIREKGCRKTTLQDIIERTGLSKGAIYHYVSGKDELFGLILKSKIESMNFQFEEAVSAATERDAKSPIMAITSGMMKTMDKDNVTNKIFTYLLSLADNPKVAAILRDVYQYTHTTAERWILTGQQAGAIPSEINAAKMAGMFMIFTYGLRVQNVVAGEGALTLEAQDVFTLLFKSLQ